MTGKDLFASLNYVDDELIEEAETYVKARILPMHSVRRIGALAACVGLLVCLTVMLRMGLFRDGIGAAEKSMMDSGAMDMYAVEEAPAEAVMDEAAAQEEAAVETEEAETEESMAANAPADAAGGVQPTERPAEKTESDYFIISDAASADAGAELRLPENGEWVCEFGLREQVMTVLRMQITPGVAGGTGKEARFLAAFRLLKDGEPVDPDSEEYLAEVQRLTELGYEFRTLYVESSTKDVKVCICGLFTAEQLDEFTAREFDANEEYGYIFYFPKNEDGTPLDWNNEAALCGLLTAEDIAAETD